MLAFQVHQIAELNIKNPANEAEKRFYQQLRKDLPDFEKLKLMTCSAIRLKTSLFLAIDLSISLSWFGFPVNVSINLNCILFPPFLLSAS